MVDPSPRHKVWHMSWEEGCEKQVLRAVPGTPKKLELLDPGVRWFVLVLEALGAITENSCDGHGKLEYWYITFRSSYKTAVRIARCGYFDVVISATLGRKPIWRLSLSPTIWAEHAGCTTWVNIYRKRGLDPSQTILRSAAESWRKELDNPISFC